MTKGIFKRVKDHVVPVDKRGREAMFAIPDGAKFMAEFRTARNPEQHALFFTMCDLLAEQTDTTKEAAKRWLLLKTGFTEMIFLPDGSMRIDPKSIAFEQMEQTEFDSFFRAAVRAAGELLHAAPKDVIDRFNDLLDPTTRADMKRRLQRKVSPPIAPADESARHDEDALAQIGRGKVDAP